MCRCKGKLLAIGWCKNFQLAESTWCLLCCIIQIFGWIVIFLADILRSCQNWRGSILGRSQTKIGLRLDVLRIYGVWYFRMHYFISDLEVTDYCPISISLHTFDNRSILHNTDWFNRSILGRLREHTKRDEYELDRSHSWSTRDEKKRG